MYGRSGNTRLRRMSRQSCPISGKGWRNAPHLYPSCYGDGRKKDHQNAVNKNRLDRSSTNDLQQTVLAESNLQDVTAIVAQMHRNREPLLHTAVYLELCAHDLERFKLLQTEVLTELIRAKLNVDRLLLRQQQGFRCVMPTGRNLFGDQFERVLPASSVANLYPFHYSGKRTRMDFMSGRISLEAM